VRRTLSGEFAGLQPHSNLVGGEAASKQAITYLRENTEATALFSS